MHHLQQRMRESGREQGVHKTVQIRLSKISKVPGVQDTLPAADDSQCEAAPMACAETAP